MEITKHFLVNLSILLILLFLYFAIIEKGKRYIPQKFSLIILFVIMLWTCIQFSYTLGPNARLDLRIIPFVIGSVYLGIGPILLLALIVFRSFYGLNTGFIETLIFYGAFTLLAWWIRPWIWRKGSVRRILFSIFLGIALGILTISGIELLDPHPNWFDAWFAYLVIPPIGIGIITYGIEFVRQNIHMSQQLVKTEKLKAVEQMGAAISHEIRNPLTAASGFVQLLQDDYLPRHKRRE
ncbi:MAG TPA: histidine kinase dimerization/phospho-acceptor domain-containing protein, partial [Neobacillus sp.]